MGYEQKHKSVVSSKTWTFFNVKCRSSSKSYAASKQVLDFFFFWFIKKTYIYFAPQKSITYITRYCETIIKLFYYFPTASSQKKKKKKK